MPFGQLLPSCEPDINRTQHLFRASAVGHAFGGGQESQRVHRCIGGFVLFCELLARGWILPIVLPRAGSAVPEADQDWGRMWVKPSLTLGTRSRWGCTANARLVVANEELNQTVHMYEGPTVIHSTIESEGYGEEVIRAPIPGCLPFAGHAQS